MRPLLAALLALALLAPPTPVTATLAGDGARLTWPGAGCAWHGSALLGCGVGGVRPGRDAANELRPGDLVVVRGLDGTLVGRARVRGLWYLPSTATPPSPRRGLGVGDGRLFLVFVGDGRADGVRHHWLEQ